MTTTTTITDDDTLLPWSMPEEGLRPPSTDSLSRLDGRELLSMAVIYRQISPIDTLKAIIRRIT
jgi:hypothetical protein